MKNSKSECAYAARNLMNINHDYDTMANFRLT